MAAAFTLTNASMSDVPREFVFTRYPARQGIVWLRTAYGMFKQHRAAWVVLLPRRISSRLSS